MKSVPLLFSSLLLLISHLSASTAPSSSLEPRVDSDSGFKTIKHWNYLQSLRPTPYDVDSCYGWIGDRPVKGEYVAMGFTPNCKIIQGDLINFSDIFQQANAEYDRYSDDSFHKRNPCKHQHLFILRLHRLDEGGLFTYHYSRVRMRGNKIEVTFFALKDVVEEGASFRAGNTFYGHPSVKFHNADEFSSSFKPYIVYSIDYEIYVWFKSKGGLRLLNYRITWDSTNSDNGYHIDVFKKFAVPNQFLPEDRIAHIITSDVEVHYFFMKTNMVFMLNHTDLINEDFSRIATLEGLKMKVDVFPRSIVGRVMSYYSLAMDQDAIRTNTKCRRRSHVIVYRNQSVNSENGFDNYMPTLTDPPLANNIYATHFRSAYPFVANGRRIKKPDHFSLVIAIVIVVFAGLFSRWVTLGYAVLPTQLARSIRMRVSVKHHYMFKSLSKHGPYPRFFLILFRTEVFLWKNGKKLYDGAKRIAWFEGDNEEETRQLIAVPAQDQQSTRESSTPNE